MRGIFCDMIETFAALAEPTRFRIVELLRSGPRPVTDIGDRLRLNQPHVSKHLRVLKEAGLVDVQPRAAAAALRAAPATYPRASRLARALPRAVGRALRGTGRSDREIKLKEKRRWSQETKVRSRT